MNDLNTNSGSTAAWDNNFLPILRRSIGILLVFQLVVLVAVFSFHYPDSSFHFYRMAPGFVLLSIFTYLLIPAISRNLGRWYIPGFIFLLTAGPYLALTIIAIFEDRESNFFKFATISRGLPLMVAALIISAWYYRLKGVALYVLASVTIDLLMNYFLSIRVDESDTVFLFRMDLRIGTFLVAGFLISKIAEHVDNNAKQLLDANSRLVHYSDTLEDLAINRERSRMARELHDTLAHSLTALTIQLEATKVLLERKPEQAASSLQIALDTARSGLKDTRSALSALRTTALESQNLLEGIISICQELPENIQTIIHTPESLPELPDQIEHGVFRIVQEAIHNATKHGEPSKISLNVSVNTNALTFAIEDNGRGFDTEKMHDGYGLLGMKERAVLAGAIFNIQSQIGQGTHIELIVPLTAGDQT